MHAAPRTTAAGNVSLGSSTHGAFAAGATRTQRRPIYSFGAVLAADHLLLGISTHDARAAAAAGTQRRPISRLGSRLTTPARRGEVNSQRPRGGGGRDIAAAHLSLRNPTRGAFATGPGRQEDSN
eukprot:tig00000369_g24605.t1